MDQCKCVAFSAILTGSRVYGKPTEDSDIDLVVLMSPEKGADLAALMGEGLNLNVIVETDPKQFEIWGVGTALLTAQAPVSRDTAVAVFAEMREKEARK